MLTIHHLHKTYNIEPVLQDVSFSISQGERVGLIGPNGCGKTTLLRIITGHEKADEGTVSATYPGLRIGYLAQGLDPDPEQTLQTALGPTSVSISDLEAEVAALATALAADPNNSGLQARYDTAINQLATSQRPPTAILGPLGLADLPPETPVSHLSGGQKTRLMLARVLLDEPHLLLLDEPTNHLDIEMLEWLESWLNGFQGAVLVVSHDRAFLDNTVTRIIELEPGRPGVCEYPGNYTDYLQQKFIEREKQQQAYADQQAEIRRMRQDISRTKEQSRHVEITTTSRQPGVRRIAKKVAKKALSREKKLERYLESDERVEKPEAAWQMKLDFGADEIRSKDVWVAEDLSVGYPGYAPLLSRLDLYARGGERIALTGSNGSGKTSLLRTIAGKLEPLAGTSRLGPSIQLGYMTQEQEVLDPNLSALESLQRVAGLNQTEARRFLHFFLFSGDDPLRPVSGLSYGERARLQLGLLVAQGCNFLLLDEPINHLDIPSRARFEQALTNFNGTILAVVHDRYFIERFATQIWTTEAGTIKLH
jgi:ATP-binding cassette subfamily F protein 3